MPIKIFQICGRKHFYPVYLSSITQIPGLVRLWFQMIYWGWFFLFHSLFAHHRLSTTLEWTFWEICSRYASFEHILVQTLTQSRFCRYDFLWATYSKQLSSFLLRTSTAIILMCDNKWVLGLGSIYQLSNAIGRSIVLHSWQPLLKKEKLTVLHVLDMMLSQFKSC